MKKRSKKIAVALAAVEAYMQDERAASVEASPLPPPLSVEPTAWALSARLDMMSGRRMMQFRAFSSVPR
jgi:hypothetical protein